jgi:hypothetical protein
LMQHSDMRLTMGPYTDSDMRPANDAVALLTKFAAEVQPPKKYAQGVNMKSRLSRKDSLF